MGARLYITGPQNQERWWGVAIIAIMVAYQTPALFANTLYLPDPLYHLYVYVVLGGITGLYGQRQFPTLGLTTYPHRHQLLKYEQ
jgi:hypothetical protein